jgi:hypothetical protein
MSMFGNNSERALVPVVDHEDPATNESDVENLIEAPARLTCTAIFTAISLTLRNMLAN